MDIKNMMHRVISGALTALVAITIAFGLLVACDNNQDNKQYIPNVEAAEETHIVDTDLVQLEPYKPFYAIYVKFDDGTVFHCVAVENSSNDSKTSALECK